MWPLLDVHYNLHNLTPVYSDILFSPAKNPSLLNFSMYFSSLSFLFNPTIFLSQRGGWIRQACLYLIKLYIFQET